MNYTPLEEELGYTFKDKGTLLKALTHASKSTEHLERQEFLGDAVLGLTIAEYLYLHYSNYDEGDLSKMRANLVCKQALVNISKTWCLAKFLNVGDGERFKDGRLKSESIAANAVESLIGAVFLDGGWCKAREVILQSWAVMLNEVEPVNLRDPKSELQELTQANNLGLPNYVVTDLGLDVSPRFQAECFVHDKLLGSGKGERKKSAELKAAKNALDNKALMKLK